MDFIIKQWFKYYTKETCRALGLVLSGTAIVCTIVCIKYKPAYTVTLAGKYLGTVENKEIVDNRINLLFYCIHYIKNLCIFQLFREICISRNNLFMFSSGIKLYFDFLEITCF